MCEKCEEEFRKFVSQKFDNITKEIKQLPLMDEAAEMVGALEVAKNTLRESGMKFADKFREVRATMPHSHMRAEYGCGMLGTLFQILTATQDHFIEDIIQPQVRKHINEVHKAKEGGVN